MQTVPPLADHLREEEDRKMQGRCFFFLLILLKNLPLDPSLYLWCIESWVWDGSWQTTVYCGCLLHVSVDVLSSSNVRIWRYKHLHCLVQNYLTYCITLNSSDQYHYYPRVSNVFFPSEHSCSCQFLLVYTRLQCELFHSEEKRRDKNTKF